MEEATEFMTWMGKTKDKIDDILFRMKLGKGVDPDNRDFLEALHKIHDDELLVSA